jgi:hypothetical protein
MDLLRVHGVASLFKKGLYVALLGILVGMFGIYTLQHNLVVGPIVLALSLIPVAGLVLARRSFKGAIPDLVFGGLDTGLLTIPALWGGIAFGVAGAIAGGVIGDALTDAIAGFFEGGIAERLRKRGIEESREPITTSLGKMAGCLFGSGIVLTIALGLGIQPGFN